MTDAPARIELCKTDDVAAGEALKVERDDMVLAVFNVDGFQHQYRDENPDTGAFSENDAG